LKLSDPIGGLLFAPMFGVEPYKISRAWKESGAMLQSAKEGILAVNREMHILMGLNPVKRYVRLSIYLQKPFRASGSKPVS